MNWKAALLLSWSVLANATDPRASYMMECQGCHGADGSGGVSTVPSLKGHVAKFLAVPGGRAFVAQVPGVAQAALSDAQVADLLNFMLAEFGPGDIARQYPPYRAEEISQLRKTPLTEVSQKRAALLLLIERQEKKARQELARGR